MPKGKPKGKPLKKDDVQKMKNEFQELDADGDGRITVEELGKVLRSMRVKLKVSEDEIKQVLADIDQDGDGTVCMEEYFSNMKDATNRNLIHRALVQRSKVRKKFQACDKDGSGYVTAEEIMDVFEELSDGELTIDEFEKILKECNTDSDGKIDYEEFVSMMIR